jgi:hypothetical protein
MSADESLQSRIERSLEEQGGPPEIAEQLVAIAESRHAEHLLSPWVVFHVGEEWSARQFEQWLTKYEDTAKRLRGEL